MKKKQAIASICLITILIVAVIGISYAAFSYIGKGSTVNQITTGTISMTYEESSNVIKIINALPTTDETGKVRLVDGEYFDFSVTTNLSGSAVINWEIAAEDFSDNTFDGSNVKFYLTRLDGDIETPVSETLPKVYSEEQEENVSTGRPSGMMSLLVGSTSTVVEETTNYRLRLYVDENYNPQGDGGELIFKTRINVYGKVSTDEAFTKLAVMKAYGDIVNNTDGTYREQVDYHAEEYRTKVTSIVTKTNAIIPSTAIEVKNGKGNYWDVSEASDGSVIAYAEDDGNNGYKITIGAKGGIVANPNSASLFCGFSNMTDINLSSFDTSNITSMYNLFRKCSSLKEINLDNFNTSNVTNIGWMFYECTNLLSLDLSSFDTSNVTTMNGMFCNCESLNSLDLSTFNTKNLITMANMFSFCSILTVLDLSSFDTSNVTNMESIFCGCSNITNLDLNSFDTSKVTNMINMFYGCPKLTTINVSSKWTTENANLTNMFANCGTDHVTVV